MNTSHLSYNRRLDKVLKVVLDYLGVEQGSLMVLEGKKLVVKAATRKKLIGYEQKLTDDSVATWVANNGKPLFIPDISQDARFACRSRAAAYKKIPCCRCRSSIRIK